MRSVGPFDRSNPDHVRVREAMPMAIQVARTICRRSRVRDSDLVADCEQGACMALQEGLPGYDPSRGPYPIYAYKRVWGAVLGVLKREHAERRLGMDAGLDAAEELRDTSSPYDDDEEAKDQLKARLRFVTFRRFLSNAREKLAADPENEANRARVAQALREALGELQETDLHFIELRYWEGLSYAKVGEAMGMHEKAAQRLDERLRQRLCRDLKRRGIDEPPASSAT